MSISRALGAEKPATERARSYRRTPWQKNKLQNVEENVYGRMLPVATSPKKTGGPLARAPRSQGVPPARARFVLYIYLSISTYLSFYILYIYISLSLSLFFFRGMARGQQAPPSRARSPPPSRVVWFGVAPGALFAGGLLICGPSVRPACKICARCSIDLLIHA